MAMEAIEATGSMTKAYQSERFDFAAQTQVDQVVVKQQDTGNRQSETRNEKKDPSIETIKDAVEKINKSASNSIAEFGIHEKTNRIVIKIVDKTTHKILKEFPPEETLDMIAKVWEQAGLIVDEKR